MVSLSSLVGASPVEVLEGLRVDDVHEASEHAAPSSPAGSGSGRKSTGGS